MALNRWKAALARPDTKAGIALLRGSLQERAGVLAERVGVWGGTPESGWPRYLSIVYSPNRFMPVKLRAFLDFALPRLKARLGDLSTSIVQRKRISRRE